MHTSMMRVDTLGSGPGATTTDFHPTRLASSPLIAAPGATTRHPIGAHTDFASA
ncbi:hypothetical protein [Gordonia sputi]